mgnify:CR=1 FL=1
MFFGKKAVSLLFAVLFCYSGIRPTFPFFNYVINFEYIATVLCINKEKKALQCKGKCQLTKEILENEPEGTSEYPQPSFEKFPNLFLEKQFTHSHKELRFLTQNAFYTPLPKYKGNLKKPPFPPPQFVM